MDERICISMLISACKDTNLKTNYNEPNDQLTDRNISQSSPSSLESCLIYVA